MSAGQLLRDSALCRSIHLIQSAQQRLLNITPRYQRIIVHLSQMYECTISPDFLIVFPGFSLGKHVSFVHPGNWETELSGGKQKS